MTTILRAQRAVADAQRRSVFYRAWSAAQGMGATHGVALGELGLSFPQGDTESLRRHFLQAAEARATITESVIRAPSGLLEPFEGALLTLGEQTGTFDRSLRLLADWHEGRHKLLLKLWSGSAYPLLLTLLAAVLLPLPLVFQGHITQYFVIAGAGVLFWCLLGGNVVYLAARLGSRRDKWIRARLARSLAAATESGASLDRVIDLSVAAAANAELEECVKRVPLEKRRAQPISETLRGCPHVPEELLSAIRVAESTGDWNNTVGRLGELYEDNF